MLEYTEEEMDEMAATDRVEKLAAKVARMTLLNRLIDDTEHIDDYETFKKKLKELRDYENSEQ